MLADPAYCDLVQNIGVASLGADEKQIWHLTKLYWFTVEFGVVREGSQVKGFGAGVLSSYGELQHMASGMLLKSHAPCTRVMPVSTANEALCRHRHCCCVERKLPCSAQCVAKVVHRFVCGPCMHVLSSLCRLVRHTNLTVLLGCTMIS